MRAKVIFFVLAFLIPSIAIDVELTTSGLNASGFTLNETESSFMVSAPKKTFGEWFLKINTGKRGDRFDFSFSFRIDVGTSFIPRLDVYFYDRDVNLSNPDFVKHGFADEACYVYSVRNGNSLNEIRGFFELWGKANCYSYDSSKGEYNGSCEHFSGDYSSENPPIALNQTYVKSFTVDCGDSKNLTILFHSKLLAPAKKDVYWEISNIVVGEERIEPRKKENQSIAPILPAKQVIIENKRTPLDDFIDFLMSATGRLVGFAVTVVFIIFFGFIAIMRIKRAEKEIEEEVEEKTFTGRKEIGGTVLIGPDDETKEQ